MTAESLQPGPVDSGPSDWQRFRDQMPIAQQWAYFDHAAVAPLPLSAKLAVTRWADEAANQGDAVWPQWNQRIEQLRQTVAELINADTCQIALMPNTTSGLNLLAEGFPWTSGDNVVTLDNEFPSNLYPWMNLADRGVTTRTVSTENGRVDLNRLADACDDRTRLVSLSWVGYASGWRIDVAAAANMAHDVGALFCLDAIQGLGVFPLDVQASTVDFLAADGHKWMLGPEGAGVCYIAPHLLERLRPLGVGWHSVEQQFDYANPELRLRTSADRYEGGSANMVGFHGLAASLETLIEFGLGSNNRTIADRVIGLADTLCDRLAPIGCPVRFQRDADHKSGIVTFDVPQVEPQAVRTACAADHVIVSCRGGGLRVTPHAYNNDEDIDRLVRVWKRFV